MLITDAKVTEYINGLYRPLCPILEELRASAEAQLIPIILRETETLLLTLLKMKNPKTILEIGTAVGYSALCFAFSTEDVSITTIELQERMQKEASANIEKAGMSEKIAILGGDALDVLSELVKKKEAGEGPLYDFVFLDGAKGHYLEVWNLCLKLCEKGAVIVSDNILFKGMTAADEYLDVRRNKTIVNRMRSYLDEITTTSGVQTSVLPVGDGVAVRVLL